MQTVFRFLVISFQSGTYGNYVSQQLVTQSPEFFCLSAFYKDSVLETKNGNRYFHNSRPFLADLFYFGVCVYPFLSTDPLSQSMIDEIRSAIKNSHTYSLLSNSKYNIVLTHMYQDGALENLKTILGPDTKIIRIMYESKSINEIANRFYDINSELNHELSHEAKNNFKLDHAIKNLQNVADEPTNYIPLYYENIFDDGYIKTIIDKII